MKRNNPRIRPHGPLLNQLIRPQRVLGIARRHKRHIILPGMAPPLLKLGVPQRKVPVPKQLPRAVLLDVLVLVQPALPPLPVAARVVGLDGLVRAGLHERAHAAPRVRARGVHVDDVLRHDVVEQPALDGAVATGDKVLLEPVLVEPLDAGFAAPARAEEFHVGVGVVGEHVDDFVVEALVEVVAVFEVGFADFGFLWRGGRSVHETIGERGAWALLTRDSREFPRHGLHLSFELGDVFFETHGGWRVVVGGWDGGFKVSMLRLQDWSCAEKAAFQDKVLNGWNLYPSTVWGSIAWNFWRCDVEGKRGKKPPLKQAPHVATNVVP